MAIAKFPVNMPQSVGRFWIPGSETSGKTDGFCKVDASGISIEVSNPLTPGCDMVQVTNGIEIRQSRDLNALIVYGTIPFAPKELTFFDAWTTTRHSVGVPFGDSREDHPQLHRLSASWCIAGAHVESPASTFEAFRVRFTHLELWARYTGIDMRIHTEKPLGAMIDFRRPQDITAPFGEFDEKDATLRLSTVGSLPPHTVWGGQIHTRNWLTFEGLSGWTLAESFERVINPVRSLLTLLAGESCQILEVEVLVGEQWCAVFGDPIKGQAERPAEDQGQMLLARDGLPLEAIAAWCTTCAELTPTPHVVAAAIGGAFQTVDTEALALTTTAEGMDAALYPGSRRFSVDDVNATKRALKALRKSKDSDAPSEVIDALSSALGLYLYKDSYPTRMKRLATDVSAASPDCVGDPDQWKDVMRKLRNDLAHSNPDGDEDAEERMLATHAAGRSLRWALQIRLLQHAGVLPEVLAAALSASRRFERDAKFWRTRFEKAN